MAHLAGKQGVGKPGDGLLLPQNRVLQVLAETPEPRETGAIA
jgi:hypothetical protein